MTTQFAIAALAAENQAVQRQVQALVATVEELEKTANMYKSNTSRKPARFPYRLWHLVQVGENLAKLSPEQLYTFNLLAGAFYGTDTSADVFPVQPGAASSYTGNIQLDE